VEKEALNFENLTGREGRFTPAQVTKALKWKRKHSTLKISQVGKGGLPPLKLQRLSSGKGNH
jgi:hypothetical protein